MSGSRAILLDQIVGEVAARGVVDRSLRDLAEAVGSSHRMLLYHFGSREGLIAAIVKSVEAAQHDLQARLAAESSTPAELVRRMWVHLSSEELRPFVRLFFECVAAGSDEFTDSWIEESGKVSDQLGMDFSEEEVRMSVALVRGLLIDVLTSGETESATAALERFLAAMPHWE